MEVMWLSYKIAQASGALRSTSPLSPAPLHAEQVLYAGRLHDIGKAYLPAQLLNKPSELTLEERCQIQQHVTIGHECVQQSFTPFDQVIGQGILHYHERHDGAGWFCQVKFLRRWRGQVGLNDQAARSATSFQV